MVFEIFLVFKLKTCSQLGVKIDFGGDRTHSRIIEEIVNNTNIMLIVFSLNEQSDLM